ncbi:hypothetical protein QA641_42685 [Bradyrhizobium sp. CB1650]|uniref:hypothetical protein n=1 Tax=Bradyrhizobium sp. CB1650 TaxID=3039153 RepID=UPI0024361224|nr:hypothetical protein [Bradyrhizobium sp. CB1650]WGD52037.1 hypothetical protein QA641_42685 [Bradyrhizobium sp. CB1650]
MPFADGNTTSKRMWRFGANCLERPRRSRERQAMQIVAGNAALPEQALATFTPIGIGVDD